MNVRCRRLTRLSALAFVLWLLTAVVVSAQDDVAGQVYRRINSARVEAGLIPLERNPSLDAAAQRHADDLAQNGVQLGHRSSDGSNMRQRIAHVGYPIDLVGENWAGYRSVDKMMDFWLSDPPHRRNILKAKFRDIGIGVSVRPSGSIVVVTDFGGGGAPPRENVNQPEIAPQAVEPTAVPPEPTPLPPPTAAPPPPEPTSVPPPPPTAVPTLAPTTTPAPTLVAIAQVPTTSRPMRLRAEIQLVYLKAEADAAYPSPPAGGDARRMLMGSTLSVGGLLLFGLGMLGHRRSRLRR